MPKPDANTVNSYPFRGAGPWALRREVARLCGSLTPLDDTVFAKIIPISWSVKARIKEVQDTILSHKATLVNNSQCASVSIPDHWVLYMVPRVPLSIATPNLETRRLKMVPSHPFWEDAIQRATGLKPVRIEQARNSPAGILMGGDGQRIDTILRVFFRGASLQALLPVWGERSVVPPKGQDAHTHTLFHLVGLARVTALSPLAHLRKLRQDHRQVRA